MLFIILGAIALLAAAVAAYLQLPVFGAAPEGERLARIQQSPNYRDGKFQNLSDTPILTGDNSALKSTWIYCLTPIKMSNPPRPCHR